MLHIRKKVLAAMSGGVDSSVAALLLKERGFEVIGITMQLWEYKRGWGGCCGLENVEDARDVANKIGIPHYVLNFREIFREKVVDNFCEEYSTGKTPNPCIRCNQYIKFDVLLRKAKELGCDYIATGHYARIEFDEQRERFILRKGIDVQKDQSYVLYVMAQDGLSKTLMPLGNLTKKEVRQIAREKRLPVADKSESQEICFIPDKRYGEFLKRYISQEIMPGPVINEEGKIIGGHKGIVFYTIGQRRGMGIPSSEPLYVTRIDMETNTITVGKKEDVFSDELIARNINYIYIERLKESLRVSAKIRYLHTPSPATITPLAGDKVHVKFDEPQWAVTPGQAVVFYCNPENGREKGIDAGGNGNHELVIGGGTILKDER